MDSQSQTQAAGLTPDEQKVMQQSIIQEHQRALQEGPPDTNKAVREHMRPRYPSWPTSQPGPLATQPPPGEKSINAVRAEQVVEVGYNQITGEPGTQDRHRSMPDRSDGPVSFDQLEDADDPRKRK